MLFSHEPNKALLIPDTCRTTERNGNSISPDVTDDAIENDWTKLVSAIFRQFSNCFGLLILHDKHNTRTDNDIRYME